MIGDDVAVDVGPVLVALDTLIYANQDTLDAVTDDALVHAHGQLNNLLDVLAPPLTQALQSVDVNLPGEGEAGPLDWSAIEQATASVDGTLAAHDAVMADVIGSAQSHVSALTDAILPSATDLLGSLVQIISDLIGGLLGSLTDTDTLWTDLYAILRKNFGEDRDPITTFTADVSAAIVGKIGEVLSQAANGYVLIGQGVLGSGGVTALDPDALAARMDAWPPALKSLVDVALEFTSAWSILGAMAQPKVSEVHQAANKSNPIIPLSPPELAELTRRNDVTREWATDEAKRSGTSPENFDLKYLLTQRFLGVEQIIDLWRRTGDDGVLDDLYRMGFATQDVERLRTLALTVATPGDVVRFLARDVFDPAAIAAGGLDTDFAQKYNKPLFDAAGVSEELAKLFWMAHWSLPSPTMGYEMMHRGLITQPQLEDLLKLADYAPGWVANLVAIAYNVPGRIDVRRMWESGIITARSDLVRRYRDMGYSPDDSDTLATFTEALANKSKEAAAERDRGPIIRAIVQEYAHGIITHPQALDSLTSLGLTPERADYKLREGDFEREQDRATRIRTAVGREYVRGFLDLESATTRLQGYGFGAQEIASLLDSWALDRELKEESDAERHQKDLSKSEILTAYRERFLDSASTAAELTRLGYDGEETATLIRLEDAKLQHAENRETEQAIHAEYVNRYMTAEEASAALSGLGNSDPRIAALMTRWTVERDSKRPRVSTAQLEKMLDLGVIPEDRLVAELIAHGYSDADVSMLLTLYGAKNMVTIADLEEKRREFDAREARLTRQGDTRADITVRGQDLSQSRFTASQSALQGRFEASQQQTRDLQQQRLDSSSLLQSARIAAQTARDAASAEAARVRQEKTIQAEQARLDKTLASHEKTAADAVAVRRAALAQQADLQQRSQASTDARQSRQLQAEADRQQRTIDAATARQSAAQAAAASLQKQREVQANELTLTRAHLTELRDIRQNAERIDAASRAEAAKVRTEQRGAARKDISAAQAASNKAALDALQFQQSAAVADLNARFAALQAQLATQRQQSALTLRQAAEEALAAATPATTLLDATSF